MPDQLQLRGGTTAEHTTFTGASKEVTVDTSKKTAVVHDGATAGGNPLMREDGANSSLALGSAASPSLKFTGDTNTGIYSPGADQVAISTNGTGRLFAGSNGDITLVDNSLYLTKTGLGNGQLTFDGSTFSVISNSSGAPLVFGTNSTERLRIDSGGRLINTGNGLSVNYNGYSDLTFTDPSSGNNVYLNTYTPGGAFFLGSNNGATFNYGWGSAITTHIFHTGAANERLRITSDGKVGVGTSVPVTPLHVSGASSTPATFERTGSNACFIALKDAASQTFIGNTNGVFSIQTPGSSYSDKLVVTSVGNVGIGTSTPTDLLTIAATAPGVDWTFAGNTAFRHSIVATGYASAAAGNHLAFKVASGSGTQITAMHMNGAGQVGVGTTSPQSILHLAGSSPQLILDPGIGSQDPCSINSWRSNAPIVFKPGDTERARIDGSGRLLVGTSSTSGNVAGNDKLAVVITGNDTQGGISVTDYAGSSSTLGSYAALRLQRSFGATDGSFTALTASAWGLGRIEFNGSNGVGFGTGASIEGVCDNLAWGNGDHPARLVFSTTADGASSPTERMRISANGYVRMMCENFGSEPSNTNQGVQISNPIVAASRFSAGSVTSTVNHILFLNGNGGVGSIATNGSATAYNTSSDYRLKENIELVTDATDRVKALKPCRFNFIADPDKTVDGFIAHEAQEVVPECVTGEKDAVDDDGNPVYQGIDQSKLVPLLTAALQEAIGEIESLKARVAALESD